MRSAVRAKGGVAETAVNALTRQAEVSVEAYYKVLSLDSCCSYSFYKSFYGVRVPRLSKRDIQVDLVFTWFERNKGNTRWCDILDPSGY